MFSLFKSTKGASDAGAKKTPRKTGTAKPTRPPAQLPNAQLPPALSVAPPPQDIADLPGLGGTGPAMTPERAQLLDQARAMYRAKQAVFAELDPKDRQKLMVMAMLTLLRRGPANE